MASISGVGVNAGRGGAGVLPAAGGFSAEGACADRNGDAVKHGAATTTAETTQRRTGNNAGMLAADLKAFEIELRGKNID